MRLFAKFAVAPSVSAEGNRCSSPTCRGVTAPEPLFVQVNAPLPAASSLDAPGGCGVLQGGRISAFLHFLFPSVTVGGCGTCGCFDV